MNDDEGDEAVNDSQVELIANEIGHLVVGNANVGFEFAGSVEQFSEEC
jgi:hypothetical protein